MSEAPSTRGNPAVSDVPPAKLDAALRPRTHCICEPRFHFQGLMVIAVAADSMSDADARLWTASSVRDLRVLHTSAEFLDESRINFELIQLQESVFVWVGTDPPCMRALDVAMLRGGATSMHSSLLKDPSHCDNSALANRIGM